MRALVGLLVCILAGCGSPQTAHSSVRITEAAMNAAHPFPTIEAATLGELKQAACGWAHDHYRAPQRASADTPVVYRELIGDPDYTSNGAPPGLGFRDVYITASAAENASPGAPEYWQDFFPTAGTYRVSLIDRRDVNSAEQSFCPTSSREVSYVDGSMMNYSGGGQRVCVSIQRADAPADAETLERFEQVAITSGRYTVKWAGYRWSGGGGALIAYPSFDVPSEEYTGEADLSCPGGSAEGLSDTPELDRRSWLIALAPLPSPVAPASEP